MRLIVYRDQPVQEIAANEATLARFAVALIAQPDRVPAAISDVPGLRDLPCVIDPDVPPLTVLLRPHPAAAAP